MKKFSYSLIIGIVLLGTYQFAFSAPVINLFQNIGIPGISGCDSLDTSATGTVVCGTDDGGGAGGSGTVTTSTVVTAGYFPKWNSVSALSGTSSIFQSGLSVGIGTSSPAELLHIAKPTGEFTTIRFDSGSTQGYFFSYDGDNSVNIGSNSNSQVNFRVNNANVGSWLTNGGLQIGTVPVLSQDGSNNLQYYRQSGSSTIFTVVQNSADPLESTITLYRDLGSGSSEFMDLYSEDYPNDFTSGIAIAASGTGTISPFALREWKSDLGVIADVGKWWMAALPSSSSGAIGFNQGTSTVSTNSAVHIVASSSVGTAHVANILRLDNTPGVTRFLFTGTGNLGIGTTTPAEALHIYKPTTEFTTIRFDSGTTQGYFFAYDGDNTVNIGSNSNSPVNIKVNNTTVATFSSGGNILVPGAVHANTLNVTSTALLGITSWTSPTVASSTRDNLGVPSIDYTTSSVWMTRLQQSFNNFFTNSSFEHWFEGTTSSTAPTGWTVQNATTSRVTTSSVGTYAVDFRTNANDDAMYQLIDAGPNVWYTCSVFYKRISGSGTASISLQENGQDFTEYTNVGLTIYSTSSWNLAIASALKPDDGTSQMRCKLAQTGATSTETVWYFDEVMLQEGKMLASGWLPRYLDDTYDNQEIHGSKIFRGQTTYKNIINSTSTVLDTVGVCGTSPTIAGSNGIGRVVTGSNASSTCTITFGTAFANRPVCQITTETTSQAGSTSTIITPTVSTLRISQSSSSQFSSAVFHYTCIGQ